MPRHASNKPRKAGADRALAFRSAHEQALDQAHACEQAFDDALASASEMLRSVDGPKDATAHLETLGELRRLIRRLQRRLDSA